jgi:hypothetical protein
VSGDKKRVSRCEVVQLLRMYMLALYSYYHWMAFYGAFREVQAYEYVYSTEHFDLDISPVLKTMEMNRTD